MRMKMKRCALEQSHRLALTIRELILILGVVATLSVAAVARYQTALSQCRLDAAARRLAADLEQVRGWARRHNCPQTLSINAEGGTYTFAPSHDGAPPRVVWLSKDPFRVSIASFPAPLGGLSRVTFDASGRPDRGGSITLRSTESQMTVHVDRVTGEIIIPH